MKSLKKGKKTIFNVYSWWLHGLLPKLLTKLLTTIANIEHYMLAEDLVCSHTAEFFTSPGTWILRDFWQNDHERNYSPASLHATHLRIQQAVPEQMSGLKCDGVKTVVPLKGGAWMQSIISFKVVSFLVEEHRTTPESAVAWVTTSPLRTCGNLYFLYWSVAIMAIKGLFQQSPKSQQTLATDFL